MGVRGFRCLWRTWEGIESFCGNGWYWMCGMGWDRREGPWVCEGFLELIWRA